MKVMIAVDGSAGAFEAVDQIGRLLSPDRDRIAFYCTPPQVHVKRYQPDPAVLARAQEGVASAIFAESRKRLPAPLQAHTETITGMQDARHSIAPAAEAWGAHLVGVGARGLGALERLLLGSVSRATVHNSTVPTWVARSHPEGSRKTYSVLLACETPELGQSAAKVLSGLTWPAGTRFTTLSVVQSIFAGKVPDWLEQQSRGPDVEAMVEAWAKEHQEEVQGCQTRMEQFVASLPAPLNAAKIVVAEGEPSREILATAQREKADLIVVGSQHKRTVANIILGSTSEAVLNHAGCSVLVVPLPPTD